MRLPLDGALSDPMNKKAAKGRKRRRVPLIPTVTVGFEETVTRLLSSKAQKEDPIA
jgi:hypothetical protein